MSDKIYDVPAEWAKRAFIDDAKYKEMYARSLADPNGFWAEQAKRIDWIKPFTKVKNTSFDQHNVSIKWFEDGATQRRRQLHRPASGQARRPDRDHLGRRRSRRIPSTSPIAQLHDEVCRFANVLKARGVKKGDRVTIYLPMIPEAAYAMLACARIGAVHSVVFGGFSPDSLAGRIVDCDSPRSSSPPTKACAAAARCRSRPIPTRRSTKAGGVDRRDRGQAHRRRRST